jgi:5-methylcytosine-specific restriction protein A
LYNLNFSEILKNNELINENDLAFLEFFYKEYQGVAKSSLLSYSLGHDGWCAAINQKMSRPSKKIAKYYNIEKGKLWSDILCNYGVDKLNNKFWILKPEVMNALESLLGQQYFDTKFYYNSKNLNASGRYIGGNRFIVFKGSNCNLNKTNTPELLNQFENLKSKGIIKKQDNDYIFVKDIIFDSPIEAISLVLGEISKGLELWKDDSGNSLQDVYTKEFFSESVYFDSDKDLLEDEKFNKNLNSFEPIKKEEINEFLENYFKPISYSTSNKKLKLKRNPTLSKAIIIKNEYKCDCDNDHSSFLNRQNNPYMEAHHLIPTSAQSQFDISLDIPQNITVLCPNCHKAIHNGNVDEIEKILKVLWQQKKDELKSSGLLIEYDDLLSFYIN